MNLVERLEKLATEFDRKRWSASGVYDTVSAERCDLLREAANSLRKETSPAPAGVVMSLSTARKMCYRV